MEEETSPQEVNDLLSSYNYLAGYYLPRIVLLDGLLAHRCKR